MQFRACIKWRSFLSNRYFLEAICPDHRVLQATDVFYTGAPSKDPTTDPIL